MNSRCLKALTSSAPHEALFTRHPASRTCKLPESLSLFRVKNFSPTGGPGGPTSRSSLGAFGRTPPPGIGRHGAWPPADPAAVSPLPPARTCHWRPRRPAPGFAAASCPGEPRWPLSEALGSFDCAPPYKPPRSCLESPNGPHAT